MMQTRFAGEQPHPISPRIGNNISSPRNISPSVIWVSTTELSLSCHWTKVSSHAQTNAVKANLERDLHDVQPQTWLVTSDICIYIPSKWFLFDRWVTGWGLWLYHTYISIYRFFSQSNRIEFGMGHSRRTQKSLRLLWGFFKIGRHYFRYYEVSYKEGSVHFVYFEVAVQIFSEKLLCHERQRHSESGSCLQAPLPSVSSVKPNFAHHTISETRDIEQAGPNWTKSQQVLMRLDGHMTLGDVSS